MRRALLLSLALAAPASAEVRWAQVSSGELHSALRVAGKIVPREGALRVESARIQGRVTSIHKREGDPVRAGELLFSVSGPECFSLAEEKRVAQEQNIQELIDAARHREKQLNLKVSEGSCDVLAAYSGIVAKRAVELGAAFNLGDALATVLDTSDLTVELEVPERDLSEVSVGQRVKLQVAADKGREFSAVVEHILPTIDPATRAGKVRLSGLPPVAGLPMDALVFAEIDMRESRRILKVPTSAVVFDKDRQFVLKRAAGDRDPVPVPVEILNEADKVSSVRPYDPDALGPGDQVAAKGALFLFSKVRAKG